MDILNNNILRSESKWRPSKVGWVRLDVDDSVNSLGAETYGGVISDEKENWIIDFSKFLGYQPYTAAEFSSILEGLQIVEYNHFYILSSKFLFVSSFFFICFLPLSLTSAVADVLVAGEDDAEGPGLGPLHFRGCIILHQTSARSHTCLAFSYAFVNKGAVSVLADFLIDRGIDLLNVTLLVTLLDAISAVLIPAVIHVSEACAGRFKAIIFCTAAYTTGSFLLGVRAPISRHLLPMIFTIALIALGKAGEEPTLRDFFDYQLREAKKKCTLNTEGEDEESESSKEKERPESGNNGSGTTNLWWYMASIMGSAMAFLCQFLFDSWRETFIVSSVVMGATYLLFFLGIFCYYPEEKPSGSPVTIIYRVFKEAIKKRRLSYPSSKHGYNNEGSDDTLDDLFYPTADNGDEVHLLPRHPSFLSFLDKAAIKNNSDDGGSEERNEKEDCTAEQVRDVKSLYPIIPLEVFTFLAYNFVSASSNTYFVLQTTNLYSYVSKFDVPIMVFPALQYLVASGVTKIIESPGTKEKVKPIWNMAFGMLFSGVCYIVAWQVERQRLSLVKSLRHPDKDIISLSIMVLIPQFLLLGLMNGFVECGLQTFSRDRVHSTTTTSLYPIRWGRLHGLQDAIVLYRLSSF
ncbi:protein NRT1/ PTR FAMILY 5.6-like [Prosopis cineraria]|uniref:protein NRT1/ PTR FAMILY 5.6-like n=1 Tax=Prosopis cineraria TaxID=364024 RepID=UPI0024102CA8|nr:protein NRT1/ PTR FAMILY 5.6-like [Prosopis cineraria]